MNILFSTVVFWANWGRWLYSHLDNNHNIKPESHNCFPSDMSRVCPSHPICQPAPCPERTRWRRRPRKRGRRGRQQRPSQLFSWFSSWLGLLTMFLLLWRESLGLSRVRYFLHFKMELNIFLSSISTFTDHTWYGLEYRVLSLLHQFHHQPLLLCSVQRSFQENLHSHTYIQMEGITKTASKYLLLWLKEEYMSDKKTHSREGLSDVWVLTKTITLSQDRVSKVWCSVLVSLLLFEREIKNPPVFTCTTHLSHTILRKGC